MFLYGIVPRQASWIEETWGQSLTGDKMDEDGMKGTLEL